MLLQLMSLVGLFTVLVVVQLAESSSLIWRTEVDIDDVANHDTVHQGVLNDDTEKHKKATNHDTVQQGVLNDDIQKYKEAANRIIHQLVDGPAKGQVYKRLAAFTDRFGPRLCGSTPLEDAIDYVEEKLLEDSLENVHKEAVTVPHWTRGRERATLISPRPAPLEILGLGTSVGTGGKELVAPVLVVRSFDELLEHKLEARGKIVLFNQAFESYAETVQYRYKGASEAAKAGAVGALIRSITPVSIYSPHTGMQTYQTGVKKIPAASLTVEDAEMLWRMSQRGENITIALYMEAQNHQEVVSYNTIAEIKGSLYPDEVVLVSGHLDSWDVGQGAMDDGGGSFISWQVLSVLRQLGLRPKRTVRLVLWTCEEFGSPGGKQYFSRHYKDGTRMDLVMESDIGTFKPDGLSFSGNQKAFTIIKELVENLLNEINATKVLHGAEVPDLNEWVATGVPAMSLVTENKDYFNYHHTRGDTMTVENSDDLDLCAAVWAVAAYVVADLEEMLPTDGAPDFRRTSADLLN